MQSKENNNEPFKASSEHVLAKGKDEERNQEKLECFIVDIENVESSLSVRSEDAYQSQEDSLQDQDNDCSSPVISILKNNDKETEGETLDEVDEGMKVREDMSFLQLFKGWSEFLEVDKVILVLFSLFFLLLLSRFDLLLSLDVWRLLLLATQSANLEQIDA